MKKILNRMDFHFYKENYIAFFVLLMSVLYIKLFNVVEIYENSIFENLATIPLIIASIFCFRAKNNKVFYRVLGLFFFLIIAREYNYGRVIFCEIPNSPHEFYSWSHYKYGWIAHVIVGLYIAGSVLYALLNKIWIDIAEIIKKVPAPPFWTFAFSFILIFVQIYYEKFMNNTLVEETAEFMLYCLALALTMIYTKKTDKKA